MMRFLLSGFILLVLCAGFSSSPRAADNTTVAKDSTQYSCVLDSLGVGEAYTILYSSWGCFHHSEDSIWVAKTYTGYNAIYHGQKKALTTPEAEAIREFELEVNRLSKLEESCTTVDDFRYRRENKTYTAGSDGTCMYHPFQDLLDALKFPTR